MRSYDWSSYIKKTSILDPDNLYKRGVQTPKMIINTIQKSLKNKKYRSILELGCSSGLYTRLIEDSLGYKLKKVGVDNNKAILKFDNLDRSIVADLFKFSSEENFDIVFSLGLIEHFPKAKREEIFLKHLTLSKDLIIIGFPNVDYSLSYLTIKLYNDLLKGNRHFRITQKEIKALARKFGLKILFEGYFSNNFILQKLFNFKNSLKNRFFLDYYLIILKK